MADSSEVVSWYNKYSKRQQKTGINLRHFTFINKCISYGLNKRSNVLEIGCGIGTLTQLIAEVVSSGKVVAADISDESIRIAKASLKKHKNLEFIVNDMQSYQGKDAFDFIILPDVLEHIPVELHDGVFKTMANNTHEKSIILINSPHPRGLDFIRENTPEKLQIIDQSLNASELINTAYNNGFELIIYESYGLFIQEYDYTFIAFRKAMPISSNSLDVNEIRWRKLKQRVRFLFS